MLFATQFLSNVILSIKNKNTHASFLNEEICLCQTVNKTYHQSMQHQQYIYPNMMLLL